MRGRKFWDCYWWNYAEDVRTRVRDACMRAAGVETVRYVPTVRMAGDSRMAIDFQVAPLRDAGGVITHLVASAVDLTDRLRAEQALLANEDARRQSREAGFDAHLAKPPDIELLRLTLASVDSPPPPPAARRDR